MNYRWDWGVLLREPYLGWLLSGLRWTLLLTLACWAIALVVGLCVGIAARLPSRGLRAGAAAFVAVFRSVPPLVQLFLWFFVVPELLPDALGLWVKRDMPMPEFTTATVALGLFGAARVAEQVRAALVTVEARLLPAALATGLRPLQAFRHVLLPIGLRSLAGPLVGEALVTMKLTSLSLTVGILELTGEGRHVENFTFQGFEAFAAVTVGYLALGVAVSSGGAWIGRRLA